MQIEDYFSIDGHVFNMTIEPEDKEFDFVGRVSSKPGKAVTKKVQIKEILGRGGFSLGIGALNPEKKIDPQEISVLSKGDVLYEQRIPQFTAIDALEQEDRGKGDFEVLASVVLPGSESLRFLKITQTDVNISGDLFGQARADKLRYHEIKSSRRIVSAFDAKRGTLSTWAWMKSDESIQVRKVDEIKGLVADPKYTGKFTGPILDFDTVQNGDLLYQFFILNNDS